MKKSGVGSTMLALMLGGAVAGACSPAGGDSTSGTDPLLPQPYRDYLSNVDAAVHMKIQVRHTSTFTTSGLSLDEQVQYLTSVLASDHFFETQGADTPGNHTLTPILHRTPNRVPDALGNDGTAQVGPLVNPVDVYDVSVTFGNTTLHHKALMFHDASSPASDRLVDLTIHDLDRRVQSGNYRAVIHPGDSSRPIAYDGGDTGCGWSWNAGAGGLTVSCTAWTFAPTWHTLTISLLNSFNPATLAPGVMWEVWVSSAYTYETGWFTGFIHAMDMQAAAGVATWSCNNAGVTNTGGQADHGSAGWNDDASWAPSGASSAKGPEWGTAYVDNNGCIAQPVTFCMDDGSSITGPKTTITWSLEHDPAKVSYESTGDNKIISKLSTQPGDTLQCPGPCRQPDAGSPDATVDAAVDAKVDAKVDAMVDAKAEGG